MVYNFFHQLRQARSTGQSSQTLGPLSTVKLMGPTATTSSLATFLYVAAAGSDVNIKQYGNAAVVAFDEHGKSHVIRMGKTLIDPKLTSLLSPSVTLTQTSTHPNAHALSQHWGWPQHWSVMKMSDASWARCTHLLLQPAWVGRMGHFCSGMPRIRTTMQLRFGNFD